MPSLIVAMTPELIIGHEGSMPWKLRTDLARFKQLTMSHHIVMGRKTYDSLGKQKLPGRIMVVITHDPNQFLEVPWVLAFDSLEDAIQKITDKELFIIGGGEIFKQAAPLVDRMYVTWVMRYPPPPGDTYFPPTDWSQWNRTHREMIPEGHADDCLSHFCIYERKVPLVHHTEAGEHLGPGA